MGWPQGQCEAFYPGTGAGNVKTVAAGAGAGGEGDGVAERARAAYAETIDATTSIQVFGMPSTAILETLERQAGAGVPLRVWSCHLGGFTRSPAER